MMTFNIERMRGPHINNAPDEGGLSFKDLLIRGILSAFWIVILVTFFLL